MTVEPSGLLCVGTVIAKEACRCASHTAFPVGSMCSTTFRGVCNGPRGSYPRNAVRSSDICVRRRRHGPLHGGPLSQHTHHTAGPSLSHKQSWSFLCPRFLQCFRDSLHQAVVSGVTLPCPFCRVDENAIRPRSCCETLSGGRVRSRIPEPAQPQPGCPLKSEWPTVGGWALPESRSSTLSLGSPSGDWFGHSERLTRDRAGTANRGGRRVWFSS